MRRIPKDNIINDWLENNSNPEINKQVEKEIIMTNLKYSFANNWKLYIGLTIFGLILIGWFGGCPREKVPATVEVTIPATTGKMESVKPKQEVITKKDSHIAGIGKKVLEKMTDKEREFFQFQLDSLLNLNESLVKEFEYLSEKEKADKFKDAIQLRYFSHYFENDTIKVELSGLARGTVESVKIDKWTYKEHKATVTVNIPKQKETFLKMNAGANIGINKELNQLVYGANVSFEGKKGNQTTANYLKIGSQDYILFGINCKILDWKRESKN